MKDSEQIPEVSGFYFPPVGPVVVASFGRGLWRLDVDRSSRGCSPRGVPSSFIEQFTLIDPATGAPVSPEPGQPLPPGCGNCSTIVAWEGDFAAAEVEQGRLLRFALRSGNPFQFSSRGAEESLGVSNVLPSQIDARKVPAVFTRLRSQGKLVKALVTRGETLVAIVVGTRDLPLKPAHAPELRVLGPTMPGGVATVAAGGRLDVSGKGFDPQAPVDVTVLDHAREVSREKVTPDEKGSFSVRIEATHGVGSRTVVATQRTERRLLGAAATFMVGGDREIASRGPR